MRGESILYYEVTKDRGRPPLLGGTIAAAEVTPAALQQRVAYMHHHLHTFPGHVYLWEPRPGHSLEALHDLDDLLLQLQRLLNVSWVPGGLSPSDRFPDDYNRFLRESGVGLEIVEPLFERWGASVEVYGVARGHLIDHDGQSCDLQSGELSVLPERYYAQLLEGHATIPATPWDEQALDELRELFAAWKGRKWQIEHTVRLAAALHHTCRATVTDGAQWARISVEALHGEIDGESLTADSRWPHLRRPGSKDILLAGMERHRDDPAVLARFLREFRADRYDYRPIPLTVVYGWFGLCCLELARDIERGLPTGRCPRCNAITWPKAWQHRDRLCDDCRDKQRKEATRARQGRYRGRSKARDAET